jgi:hypothetical protein
VWEGEAISKEYQCGLLYSYAELSSIHGGRKDSSFVKCAGYISDDVAGDGRLEMSKRKYDSAKHRVAKLHKEFDELKQQLEGQVKSLDHARGDLVTQIKTAEGLPVAVADDSSDNFADADIDFGSLLKNKNGKDTRKDARRFVCVFYYRILFVGALNSNFSLVRFSITCRSALLLFLLLVLHLQEEVLSLMCELIC